MDNLTLTEETPTETEDESVSEEVHGTPDIVEEDGGHFNRNKDTKPSFSASEEPHQARQDILESSLDMDVSQGLDVEPEHPSSGW